MILLICGSRSINDSAALNAGFAASGYEITKITEVVSGGSSGVDKLAERWSKTNRKKNSIFMANWIENGRYAGFVRNAEMIKYLLSKKEVGEDIAVLAIWDGVSRGTKHTIDLAAKFNIPCYVHKEGPTVVEPPPERVGL